MECRFAGLLIKGTTSNRSKWRMRAAKGCFGSCVTSITGPNGGAELYER